MTGQIEALGPAARKFTAAHIGFLLTVGWVKLWCDPTSTGI
jgi:hypothetical protein